MEFNIIARRFTLTDAISEYVRQKIESAAHRVRPSPISAHVILSVEKKYRHTAEIVVRIPRARFLAKGSAGDLYAAIDIAVDKLARQLLKHKEKIKDHRSKSAVLRKEGGYLSSEPVEISIFPEKTDSDSVDIADVAERKTFDIENITLSEAMKELERSGYNFYVFNNSDAGGILSIVYKRGDGRIGLMEIS